MESQVNFIQAAKWLTEVLIGFMDSPGWLCPIHDFIDHNCESFEQEEENKLAYTSIYIEYCEMIEGMLQNISRQLNISEEVLVGVVDEALRHRKISFHFELVLATVDFLVFKRIMVNRNIEIKVEIAKKLGQKNLSNDAKRELENLELALALSLICKEEYETHRIDRRIKEDEELKRALEESSNEYIEEMQRQKMRILKEIEDAEEELRRKKEVRKSQEGAEAQEAALRVRKKLEITREKFEEEAKKQRSEMENLEKLREMKRNIELEKEKRNQTRKEEEQLLIQKKIERKRLEDTMGINEGNKERKGLVLEEAKQEELAVVDELGEGNESVEQRKERLNDQRDLVIKKLKHDRYEQLVEHMNNGGADFTYKPEQVSLIESNKRKRILDKLKEGGHLPFNNN